MKYGLIISLLCAPLLFSGVVGFARQQENINISTSEGAAMESLRALLSAETTFQRKGGTGEYGELKDLHTAGLIDDALASGLKGDYRFIITIKKSTLTTPPSIDLIARPSKYGKPARRSFYLTESGVLLTSEVKDAPLSEMRPFATGNGKPKADVAARAEPPPAEMTDEDSVTSNVAANEAQVINTLQLIHSAETTFKTKPGAGGYGSLEQLEKQHLIEGARAAATQDGYVFEVRLQAGNQESPAAFRVSAVPQTYGLSGRRSFYIDQTGTLRGADKEGGPADVTDPKIEE